MEAVTVVEAVRMGAAVTAVVGVTGAVVLAFGGALAAAVVGGVVAAREAIGVGVTDAGYGARIRSELSAVYWDGFSPSAS